MKKCGFKSETTPDCLQCSVHNFLGRSLTFSQEKNVGMSFSLLFLGPKYATGTTSGGAGCILAKRQRAQSFVVKTAWQDQAVHIMATERKTGTCWHSALTFSLLPGPQPMGWHHPQSGWMFSLQLVLLGIDGPGRGELLPPRCSHVNSKVSCHSRPLQLVFPDIFTYVLLATRKG